MRLVDGHTIQVPLAWYPRLWYGTPAEREQFELLSDGAYIHWSQLEEDLSVTGILLGKRSGESQESLQKWLDARAMA